MNFKSALAYAHVIELKLVTEIYVCYQWKRERAEEMITDNRPKQEKRHNKRILDSSRETEREFIKIGNKTILCDYYLFADTNIWSQEICIPENRELSYRYLVCAVDPATGNIHVRRWETHLTPRHIPAFLPDDSVLRDSTVPSAVSAPSSSRSRTSDTDTFGDIAGVEKVDRGWLTTETVFQFKFIRNPFMLKQKLKNKLLYVKVSESDT